MHLGRPVGGGQEAVRQLHKVVLLSLALVQACMRSRPGCVASVVAQIRYAQLMHPGDGRSNMQTCSTTAAPAWGQQSSGQAHPDSCGLRELRALYALLKQV